MPHFNPPQNPKEADRIASILQMKDLRLSHVYAHTPQVRGGGFFCLHVSPNSAPAPDSERTEAAQTGTLQHLRQFPSERNKSQASGPHSVMGFVRSVLTINNSELIF